MNTNKAGVHCLKWTPENIPTTHGHYTPRNSDHSDSKNPCLLFMDYKKHPFTITDDAIEYASRIATYRTQMMNTVRKKSGDIGSDEANVWADFWGALAEVVAYYELLDPYNFSCPSLQADGPDPNPDFTMWGKRYDIKSVAPGKKYLCINERAHYRWNTDFYLPVRFFSESHGEILLPTSHETVDCWGRRYGHSWYRSSLIYPLGATDLGRKK